MNLKVLLLVLSFLSFTVLSEKAGNIHVEISDIPLGDYKLVEWRGYPVYVLRLNKTQQNSLLKNTFEISYSNLKPTYNKLTKYFNSELSNLLFDSTLKTMTTESNIIVLFGVSIESSCMIITLPNQNVLEDPCSFSTFSYDGRPIKHHMKQSFTLLSPPFKIKDEKVIILNNSHYEER